MRNKKALKNKRLKWIKELLIYVVIIVFCATLFPKYVIRRTQVDGNSMETTLQDKDDLIVEKVTYHFKDPDRFDIITFYPKGRNAKEYYIKRVIGLPGETIQIIGDTIYINGNVLKEYYGLEPMLSGGIAKELILEKTNSLCLAIIVMKAETAEMVSPLVLSKRKILMDMRF